MLHSLNQNFLFFQLSDDDDDFNDDAFLNVELLIFEFFIFESNFNFSFKSSSLFFDIISSIEPLKLLSFNKFALLELFKF